jgi:NhaP-type Na+/H+ or K+/H+ antiporter
MTLRHYAYPNMSIQSRRTTRYMLHVVSQLSENFIFIYLGITLFTATDSVFRPLFILCVTVSSLLISISKRVFNNIIVGICLRSSLFGCVSTGKDA